MNAIYNLVENSKILDSNEQNRLIKEYKETGNLEARNKLINSYYKMIVKIVNKYQSNIPIEDLFNEGIVGLIKAIDGYNLNSDNLFSTYAYKAISMTVYTYLVKHQEEISYSLDFLKIRKKYNRILEQKPTITDSELKKILNVSDTTLANLKEIISIIYYEDDSDKDNIDFKESQYFKSLDPLDDVEESFYQKQLLDLIFNNCNLNEEEKMAIRYLYIKDLSINSIENMGYSRNDITKNKEKALKKVRKVFFKNGIKYK